MFYILFYRPMAFKNCMTNSPVILSNIYRIDFVELLPNTSKSTLGLFETYRVDKNSRQWHGVYNLFLLNTRDHQHIRFLMSVFWDIFHFCFRQTTMPINEPSHGVSFASFQIHLIDKDGNYSYRLLGDTLRNEEHSFFAVVPHETWMAAERIGECPYVFYSATSAPGWWWYINYTWMRKN